MHVIRSVESALKVLGCFSHEPPALGVTEIAARLRLTKSTVSRILSTLAQERFVAQIPESQKYRLGTRVLQLAGVFLSGYEWRRVALPQMRALRDACGETVALSVVDGEERVCLEKCESAHDLRSSVTLGGRYPLNAGAGGKLLLAHLPAEERRKTIRRTGLQRYTPHTITGPKALDRELEGIRRRGYATSSRERVPHLSSVAAPIRDFEGRVVAALSVDGPAVRFTPRKMEACATLLLSAAEGISQEIGYRPEQTRTIRPPSGRAASNHTAQGVRPCRNPRVRSR